MVKSAEKNKVTIYKPTIDEQRHLDWHNKLPGDSVHVFLKCTKNGLIHESVRQTNSTNYS